MSESGVYYARCKCGVIIAGCVDKIEYVGTLIEWLHEGHAVQWTCEPVTILDCQCSTKGIES